MHLGFLICNSPVIAPSAFILHVFFTERCPESYSTKFTCAAIPPRHPQSMCVTWLVPPALVSIGDKVLTLGYSYCLDRYQ